VPLIHTEPLHPNHPNPQLCPVRAKSQVIDSGFHCKALDTQAANVSSDSGNMNGFLT